MRGVRVGWIVLAGSALVYTVWAAFESAGASGCGKGGPRYPSGTSCESSTDQVLGVWSLLGVGLVLIGPPLVAALAMRIRVSWLAVVGLGAAALLGGVHMSESTSMLRFAGPMLLFALVVTLVQTAFRSYDGRGAHTARVRPVKSVRVSWIVLAGSALVYTVWTAFGPASAGSLGCRQGEGPMPSYAPTGATCESPLYHVFGIWPALEIGLILVAPPLIAALAMRTWVSWLTVVGLGVIAFLGLAHWAEFWGTLLFAIPMLIVALFVTGFQTMFRFSGGGAAHGVPGVVE
ncbi:MAG: hypothetical protein QM809_06860 [Gordonia sp. (in: high G+C Gram-positive bacteria)]|uniref:hypothetical protein n=1 Tax=Gordonia sp. (in: high G+C Gram-positive bacteria) TaxID=84139 RepID=UPI0039E29260